MFTDILGIALTMAGGWVALEAYSRSSPVCGAIAFALLVGAAMTIWAGGVKMVPVIPPDDWDDWGDERRL